MDRNRNGITGPPSSRPVFCAAVPMRNAPAAAAGRHPPSTNCHAGDNRCRPGRVRSFSRVRPQTWPSREASRDGCRCGTVSRAEPLSGQRTAPPSRCVGVANVSGRHRIGQIVPTNEVRLPGGTGWTVTKGCWINDEWFASATKPRRSSQPGTLRATTRGLRLRDGTQIVRWLMEMKLG
jgi:hypothetical protein